ncbi:MAG: sulfotransferase [Chloroflexi bacterium]|nr:sulfotransferase [Chloroflexota bacterium]
MTSVVYVVGTGRSGSTVLDTLLGSHPRAVSTGELSHLVRDGWMGIEICACGKAVVECPHWMTVRAAWTAQFGEGAVPEYPALQRSVERLRRVPGFILGSRRVQGEWERYQQLTRGLFRAIIEATDRDVIIDSSKNPVRALALSRAGIELRLIHLVRDPRAVAWSFGKSFTRDRAGGVQRDRAGTAAWRSALKWQLINAEARLVTHRMPANRSMTVRYEDLVTHPRATLDRIGRLINLNLEEVAAAAEAGRPVVIGHPVAGNRLRMSGMVSLAGDDEWRRAMPQGDQRLVSILAQPSMRTFGYR